MNIKRTTWDIIGLLLAILGIFLTVCIFFVQKRNARLFVSYDSKLQTEYIISKLFEYLDSIGVNYEDSEIDRLTLTLFKIKNTGNVLIQDEDLYNDNKLKIQLLSDNAEVFYACVWTQASDINNCHVIIDEKDKKYVNVLFDALEKKDEIQIEVFHTGDENTAFSISGRIKDGGKIDTLSRAGLKRYSMIAWIVGIGGAVVIVLLIIVIDRTNLGNTRNVLIVTLYVVLIFYIIILFHVLKMLWWGVTLR